MRLNLASGILLCFLAAQFSVNNAGVVPAKCQNADCTQIDNIEWSVFNDLSRRAGGGGEGGRGGGRQDGGGGTGGGGGTSGGGNGSPHSDGGQTGETGGFGGQESEGGFTGTPANIPANAPVNTPANNPAYPPSARNNFNKPAQSGERTYNPSTRIDLAVKVSEYRARIQQSKFPNRPWFFYSGFENKEIVWDSRKTLSDRLGVTRKQDEIIPGMNGDEKEVIYYKPYLEDAMAPANADLERMTLTAAESPDEKVYIVIPEGRPINISKDNGDDSVWWSFEALDLSHNPGVESITYVSIDPTRNLEGPPYYDLDPDVMIWRRGDPPLGTPGDEHYTELAPAQPWSG